MKKKNKVTGVIVVLGSPNSPTGELYSVARERCEHALDIYLKNPGMKLLLTGGFGPHFNITPKPHAYYLREFLKTRGIPDEDFIGQVESANTREDAAMTKAFVREHNINNVVVVTSDYHLARAQRIFETAFADLHVTLTFSPSITDRVNCDLDIESLEQHERTTRRN